jgi:hypothetical protein
MSPVWYELGFYIPEDGILHSQGAGNLKSYILLSYFSVQFPSNNETLLLSNKDKSSHNEEANFLAYLEDHAAPVGTYWIAMQGLKHSETSIHISRPLHESPYTYSLVVLLSSTVCQMVRLFHVQYTIKSITIMHLVDTDAQTVMSFWYY